MIFLGCQRNNSGFLIVQSLLMIEHYAPSPRKPTCLLRAPGCASTSQPRPSRYRVLPLSTVVSRSNGPSESCSILLCRDLPSIARHAEGGVAHSIKKDTDKSVPYTSLRSRCTCGLLPARGARLPWGYPTTLNTLRQKDHPWYMDFSDRDTFGILSKKESSSVTTHWRKRLIVGLLLSLKCAKASVLCTASTKGT